MRLFTRRERVGVCGLMVDVEGRKAMKKKKKKKKGKDTTRRVNLQAHLHGLFIRIQSGSAWNNCGR